MTVRVLLPVTQEAFDEIADEIVARGQADRVEGSTMVVLTDVVLVVAPERKMAQPREKKR